MMPPVVTKLTPRLDDSVLGFIGRCREHVGEASVRGFAAVVAHPWR